MAVFRVIKKKEHVDTLAASLQGGLPDHYHTTHQPNAPKLVGVILTLHAAKKYLPSYRFER